MYLATLIQSFLGSMEFSGQVPIFKCETISSNQVGSRSITIRVASINSLAGCEIFPTGMLL